LKDWGTISINQGCCYGGGTAEERIMSTDIFPQSTPDLAAARKKLAPHIHDAFIAFRESAFAAKIRQQSKS